jgi:hypothetical protein
MSIPSAASLLTAGVVYLVHFSIPPGDAVGWLDISLFTFNFLYLLATIPCALYIARAYEEGPSYHPFL